MIALKDSRQAIHDLGVMVRTISEAGIGNNRDFAIWKRSEEGKTAIDKALWISEGGPCGANLLQVDFHKELPLILLNYSKLAHNTLHVTPQWWTAPLRHCRGIVFDLSNGNLIALPFPKFFNYREHPETMELPKLPFEAWEKMDGHLGIIFEYRDKWLVTTRGYFDSPTATMAQGMLDELTKRNRGWEAKDHIDTTFLAEIVTPETRVHIDYPTERQGFTLLGGYDRKSSMEVLYGESLMSLFSNLLGMGLPSRQKTVRDPKSIIDETRRREVKGKEGFVLRFEDGLRVKVKYQSYLGLMFAAKLSIPNVMKHLMAGSLEDRIGMMTKAHAKMARGMIAKVMGVANGPQLPKETFKQMQRRKWTELYGLLRTDERTDHFKGICRDFIKSVCVE